MTTSVILTLLTTLNN